MRDAHVPLFVKCLVALPNLHTLEIAEFDGSVTDKLRTALSGIKLPQVKTLILPAAAHPLLKHCREVEDIVVVVAPSTEPSDAFLMSLAFNWDSKVRRLAIPLTEWDKPSRESSWSLDVIIEFIHICNQGLLLHVQSLRNSPSSTLSPVTSRRRNMVPSLPRPSPHVLR